MMIRFNDALRRYLGAVRDAASAELVDVGNVIVVRDVVGRLHLATERRPNSRLEELQAKLRDAAGPYYADGILVKDEMFAPDDVFDSDELYIVEGIQLLERVVIGADWTRPPLPNIEPRPPRATLYGVKGGVGRSTALCAWARELARDARRVLVIDLDLESPGVSTSLLPPDLVPDAGILDWLVEEGVDNTSEDLVGSMAARSPLDTGMIGEILVTPCCGADGEGYLAKLARAYLDIPASNAQIRSFATRVAQMVDSLEAFWKPDVVLIDSRAGLHDLAAIATTRLGAMTFLFATDARQTWEGYRTLLQNWKRRPTVAKEVRSRLRVVAAQVPETGRDEYLERLTTNSYDVFADGLYEEVGPADSGAFNFDVLSSDAPHYPLPIYWSRPFQEWDPLRNNVTEDQIRGAFGRFLDAATDLLLDPVTGDATE